jgi:hypothetical protein
VLYYRILPSRTTHIWNPKQSLYKPNAIIAETQAFCKLTNMGASSPLICASPAAACVCVCVYLSEMQSNPLVGAHIFTQHVKIWLCADWWEPSLSYSHTHTCRQARIDKKRAVQTKALDPFGTLHRQRRSATIVHFSTWYLRDCATRNLFITSRIWCSPIAWCTICGKQQLRSWFNQPRSLVGCLCSLWRVRGARMRKFLALAPASHETREAKL